MNQKKLEQLKRYTVSAIGGVDLVGMTATEIDFSLADDGEFVKYSDLQALLDTDKSEGEFDLSAFDEAYKKLEFGISCPYDVGLFFARWQFDKLKSGGTDGI